MPTFCFINYFNCISNKSDIVSYFVTVTCADCRFTKFDGMDFVRILEFAIPFQYK